MEPCRGSSQPHRNRHAAQSSIRFITDLTSSILHIGLRSTREIAALAQSGTCGYSQTAMIPARQNGANSTGIVAIHQPNFFPWLGYFDKIARSDVFVFLDGVSYPKNSWVNRVRLNIQREARWTTCPVRRATMQGPIANVVIDDGKPWREKLLKTLDANYRRAVHFDQAMLVLEPLIRSAEPQLANFNIAAIVAISSALGIETKFVRQTELAHAGTANDLLVSLVRAVGGTCYLVGGGADGYHDDATFCAAALPVCPQSFEQKPYGSPERFLPGLSIIDYLMHDGRSIQSR